MRGARAKGQLLAVVVLALSTTGCYTFAMHQTAERLAPGQRSITAGISRQAFISGEDWDYEDGFSVADVQVRLGLERFEIGVRISRINLQDGYQFVSLDPKISLVEDRLAFLLPVGLFFSGPFPGDADIDVSESHQVHPALIATIPLGRTETELNLGLKTIVLLDTPEEYFTGLNLGLVMTPDEVEGGPAVLPEIGMFTDSHGNYYFHWGMALSFAFGGP
ncbi:MAG: hypothetical protein OXG13_12010 [Gemmatimonadaceae bacterium]|nr:hypothetical protein [Gemmatimonadaceae bacterium]